MKVLGHISIVMIGIVYGVLLSITYMVFALALFLISISYLGDFEEILSKMYIYYLPFSILLASVVLKQYKESFIILVAICTELYFLYLWKEYWENTTWTIF